MCSSNPTLYWPLPILICLKKIRIMKCYSIMIWKILSPQMMNNICKEELEDQRTINHILFPFQDVVFQDNNSFNIITERKLHRLALFFHM